jgi:hypothetical protein
MNRGIPGTYGRVGWAGWLQPKKVHQEQALFSLSDLSCRQSLVFKFSMKIIVYIPYRPFKNVFVKH